MKAALNGEDMTSAKPAALNGRMFRESWKNRPDSAFVLSIYVCVSVWKAASNLHINFADAVFLLIIGVSNLTPTLVRI